MDTKAIHKKKSSIDGFKLFVEQSVTNKGSMSLDLDMSRSIEEMMAKLKYHKSV